MENAVSFIQPIKSVSFSKVGQTETATGASSPFLNVLKNAVDEYTTLQQKTDENNNALALGETDNLAQIQIDSMKAETALQTTVQLTSRVISAYKEIMQMNI